jgi:hypothetical protein
MEKLTALYYHEAKDRSNTVNEIIEIMLLKHPVLEAKKHKDWRDKIIKAQETITEVYTEIGNYEAE